jgi:hypothetical protein
VGITGPKKQDWSPPRLSEPADLLTPLERGVLERLKDADLSLPTLKADIESLRQIASRLARLKADDFDFPEYAAFVNHISCTAYAMRFDKRVSLEAPVDLEKGQQGWRSESLTTASQPCDAILAVLAYVRVASPAGQGVIEELRKAVFFLSIDGNPVVQGEPLAGYLVLQDGTGVRRLPRILRRGAGNLFTGCAFTPEQEADPSRHYGIMMPNQSVIQMELKLENGLTEEPVRLRAGLVAARYTTKAR